MDALGLLQGTLRKLNRVALARLRLGDSLRMIDERTKLQAWIGGTSELEDASSNTIEAAVKAFRQGLPLKGTRQIRLVCYGCTQSFGNDTFRLIESRELFFRLLECLNSYSERKRLLLKFYRALLSSYFSYDPDAPGVSLSGRGNWELLRTFLADQLDSLLIVGAHSEWLIVLSQHPNLLGDNPCQPYEAAALHGDLSSFNEIRAQLGIGADSWPVRQMIMTSITAVADMDDTEFKEHLDNILLLLNEYPLYAATGLQILLDRYTQCEEQEVSTALGDFAIRLWGNPWLPENSHQWQCSVAARKMLALWLKRHLLSEFFSLLCDDDSSLARRLNFWDLYCENLTGMYFALGKDAFASGNMSLYKFRHHAKGLVTKLSEGKPDVHVCIMQFEHHHVVEFNRDNNMAYFYDIRQGMPPFYLSKGWLEIGAISVANLTPSTGVANLSTPLRHQDTKQLSWEGRFAQELGAKENAIKTFCRKYQCQYDDRRDQDGRQWIRPTNPQQYGNNVWSVLAGWGFCFLAEENGYFRQVSA